MSLYKQVFSRDFTLCLVEIWYKGEAYDIKPWSGLRQARLPYIVLLREDDTVKSYYDPKGVDWIHNHIIEAVKTQPGFFDTVERELLGDLEPIREIYEQEQTLSRSELLKFLDSFYAAYPWIEVLWWLCEISPEKLGGLDITRVFALREKTNSLSVGTDAVIRKSLTKLLPELQDYVHVLRYEEIKNEKYPSIEELQQRDKGYIFTDNQLYVTETIGQVEEKYGITLDRPIIDRSTIREIKGTSAGKGIVTGTVRRVMGHKQIPLLRPGEILVSPMTMPDFLPAMKKAAAFVTDEGGLTCHAAIVARELSKPCIVGTKIATQVFKDGDMVEVDADTGIVRILD